MKIFVCQIKPEIGNLEKNYLQILRGYEEALIQNCDLCLFPELAISGYMSEDLFLNTQYISDITDYTIKLIDSTKDCALVLPTVINKEGKVFNGTIVAENKKIIGTTFKHNLPNYGIFDEKRYFSSGKPVVIDVKGLKIGIPICEDIWDKKVCRTLKNQGAQLFLVPNGSPYDKFKIKHRINLVEERFKETSIPMIYCNQVVSQDGIVFDGTSFCYDGKMQIIGKSFCQDYNVIEFSAGKFKCHTDYDLIHNSDEEILGAIIFATREYVLNNGFTKVILGLSGGIDSALVAYIAARALGKENVIAYMLPFQYTSKESIDDALELSSNLGIRLHTIPIDGTYNAFDSALEQHLNSKDNSITFQNLQSRIRGTILMALANENHSLLLTTGNKSEYAVGYATIYGDMNGAFNPIKDIYKTEIYDLAKKINLDNNIIPERIISRFPSAELAPNQKDSDTLPNYDILDQILVKHIELNESKTELYKKFAVETVNKVLTLVKNAEFKRRQSAPGVKISTKNFEKDRRYPITNFYDK